jgi:hypothetical protein
VATGASSRYTSIRVRIPSCTSAGCGGRDAERCEAAGVASWPAGACGRSRQPRADECLIMGPNTPALYRRPRPDATPSANKPTAPGLEVPTFRAAGSWI